MLGTRCCSAAARTAAGAGLAPLQARLAVVSSVFGQSSSCVSPASALAPAPLTTSSRRDFHASSAAGIVRKVRQQPGMIANTFFYPPPAEGAAAAILEARRQIFGHVPGDGTRSGRKALRQQLKGQVIKDWYHLRITDLPLHEIGLENPVREELYRKEEELNRIGKTRIKGKVRGPGEEFVREMKLQDATEEILEPIDMYLPEDALPEDGSADRLAEELELDEVRQRELRARMERVCCRLANCTCLACDAAVFPRVLHYSIASLLADYQLHDCLPPCVRAPLSRVGTPLFTPCLLISMPLPLPCARACALACRRSAAGWLRSWPATPARRRTPRRTMAGR